MNTIMKPDFKATIANIISEFRTMTCIDVDAESIEKILQAALEEECYNAISSAQSIAYDAGHSDGYDDGYENGYADCHAKNSYQILRIACNRAALATSF